MKSNGKKGGICCIREKWKKLADAFDDKAVSQPIGKMLQEELAVMARRLAGFTEEQWGIYAFNREPLEGKFDLQQKQEYIRKANACGKEWAVRMRKKFQTSSPKEIAVKMGLKISSSDTYAGGNQLVFAQFTRPDQITIYMDCIRRASRLREESGCDLLDKERLFNVLLAHELFHAIEEQYSDEIYTMTEKVELWRKPFSNRSPIACLSEIGAMAFARELLGLDTSPYMLDVLLVYAYDREVSWRLYEEIVERMVSLE